MAWLLAVVVREWCQEPGGQVTAAAKAETRSLLCFRSDEEEGSGSKYGRMESTDDNMQDKERFAR